MEVLATEVASAIAEIAEVLAIEAALVTEVVREIAGVEGVLAIDPASEIVAELPIAAARESAIDPASVGTVAAQVAIA